MGTATGGLCLNGYYWQVSLLSWVDTCFLIKKTSNFLGRPPRPPAEGITPLAPTAAWMHLHASALGYEPNATAYSEKY